MRPPTCFLCHDDFAASTGELVHFVVSDKGTAWEQRVNDAGRPMPGHHPDKGWFCETHADAALKLATTHTIDNALRSLRDETAEQ